MKVIPVSAVQFRFSNPFADLPGIEPDSSRRIAGMHLTPQP